MDTWLKKVTKLFKLVPGFGSLADQFMKQWQRITDHNDDVTLQLLCHFVATCSHTQDDEAYARVAPDCEAIAKSL
jgi:hypothetical protein